MDCGRFATCIAMTQSLRLFTSLLFTFGLLIFGHLTFDAVQAGDAPAITAEVQAIFDRNCVKCHGPLEQNSGLRLDSAAAVWRGSSDGPIVIARQPENSKLIQVLASDSDPHMPPKKQLTEADIAVLRAWVATA